MIINKELFETQYLPLRSCSEETAQGRNHTPRVLLLSYQDWELDSLVEPVFSLLAFEWMELPTWKAV